MQPAMPTLRTLGYFAATASLVFACSANTDDSVVAGDPQALTECDSTGQWAIRVDTPVKWAGSFILKAGTGTISNWLLSNRTASGLAITDSAQLCGVTTPDYVTAPALGNEKIGITFSATAFDKAPTLTLSGTLSSKEVGATYSSPATAALVGATLANPTTDAWPDNVDALASVDVEQDGNKGVTADAKNGDGFVPPPVNVTRTVRASKLHTAFRQVLESTSGTVKSCTRVDGVGKIAQIGGKPAINNHIVGCTHTDGTACSASEYKLLDTSAPRYEPTGDSVITMVKVPTAATCADVRALDFANAP
jgi:hypothetical protein